MAGVLNEMKGDVVEGAAEEWLTRKQACLFLRTIGCPISPNTLANMGANDNAGGGPPFMRFRWNAVRYRKSDLIDWARTQAQWVK